MHCFVRAKENCGQLQKESRTLHGFMGSDQQRRERKVPGVHIKYCKLLLLLHLIVSSGRNLQRQQTVSEQRLYPEVPHCLGPNVHHCFQGY